MNYIKTYFIPPTLDDLRVTWMFGVITAGLMCLLWTTTSNDIYLPFYLGVPIVTYGAIWWLKAAIQINRVYKIPSLTTIVCRNIPLWLFAALMWVVTLPTMYGSVVFLLVAIFGFTMIDTIRVHLDDIVDGMKKTTDKKKDDK